ncbi:MAG: class I tRNA ligase family protein [bacterium]
MKSETDKPETKKTESALREERILSYWRDKSIFEKTLQKSSPKGNWVFYDGPPYATGLPHFGHILPTTIKDVFPRYKTMQGYHVERRWGWDCHGLPIENLVEKELGLKNKKEIDEYGIDKFNKKARESVFTYVNEWKSIIPRLGRFADMDNDYRTMDASFMESVWWTFKTLFDKGLVYEGYKVMYVCPRCETPLSNSEVASGGYKDITDISAFVLFKLAKDFKKHDNVSILAWTTTPWTLPGNTAIAVNSELEYVLIQTTDKNNLEHKVILAKARLEAIKTEYKILEEFKGLDLAGLSYAPVFPYYAKEGTLIKTEESKRAHGWKIYTADFVTATDGTGVVHIAPAYGEDDLNLANAHNIPVIQHVGMDGLMKPGALDFIGMPVKPKAANASDHQKTDIEIIKWLAKNGSLFEKLKIIHSYPHCWRCETPLLNYATTAWFVRVTQFKDRMVELNKTIKWLPEEIGEGRFGKWLENVRDWNISRSRYWGTPLPIWRNEKGDDVQVLGSIHDIKKKLDIRGNKYAIMRHGESESNVLGVIDHSNVKKHPLTERGKMEVTESVKRLKKSIEERGLKISCIYTSPIERTLETANIVSDILGIPQGKIIVDQRLREISCGEFEGKAWTDYHNYFKTDEDKLMERLPNGESNADVKKRVAEFLYEVDAKHENELIIVVTHGLPLRLAHEIAAGKTNRDMLRKGWEDVAEDTGSHQWVDFVALPHNEEYEFDMHRPFIDGVTWKNEKGQVMKRVPEVFDVWYDSGAMPYAQSHYPFEHQHDLTKKGGAMFPADFIAEGLDQTRGWFYSLTVLACALFDSVAFKNVVVNGLVLAEDGRKMSKRLNNYPDLIPTVEKYSADALRFLFAQSSAVRSEEVKFSEKSLDEVNKKVFLRLSNIVTFYETYKGEISDLKFDRPTSTKHILDAWILARLDETLGNVTRYLDNYELDKASRPIADFIDDMSTWYLRRSRDRFKSDDIKDKESVIATTGFVLYTLSLILAPIAPFFAEDLYLNLTRGEALDSVHLESWPVSETPDQTVIENTRHLRSVVEKALALRSKAGMKVRQPLASLSLDSTMYPLFKAGDYADILKDEINVKDVLLITMPDDVENPDKIKLDTHLTEDLTNEGRVRELTRAIQELRKKSGLSAGDQIVLQIATEENFSKVIKQFSKDLMSTVSAREIKMIELHIFDTTMAEHGHTVGSESIDIDGSMVRVALFT